MLASDAKLRQHLEHVLDDNIILDGSEVVTQAARFITHNVKVIRNETDTANIYQIDVVEKPTLILSST